MKISMHDIFEIIEEVEKKVKAKVNQAKIEPDGGDDKVEPGNGDDKTDTGGGKDQVDVGERESETTEELKFTTDGTGSDIILMNKEQTSGVAFLPHGKDGLGVEIATTSGKILFSLIKPADIRVLKKWIMDNY